MNEIRTQYYGFTLDGALNARLSEFSGILNGIDYDIYNPETDKHIEYPFNKQNFVSNKKEKQTIIIKTIKS